MSETTPDDLTADELYTLLKDNPDQDEFTSEDLTAAQEARSR